MNKGINYKINEKEFAGDKLYIQSWNDSEKFPFIGINTLKNIPINW